MGTKTKRVSNFLCPGFQIKDFEPACYPGLNWSP
ncbi:hypothetical protein H206_05240 [Candidatus Electrothrix aarhusensis]|uniref:Uncharacterized protein n=1 Tax=Candidatus Electrothrix aarhusensis TaxID=1859131 RepID=A0A444J526_9BACT|nr:hypothetical protein H206_05240 [Candidatus Electrothrix aarhusensis]